MDTRRWRRQDGLIREALYIFLVIAVVMAVLLDGVAILKVQSSARDVASDAGAEARAAYANSGDAAAAKRAAADRAEQSDADMLDFLAQGNLTSTATFTVTVQSHTDTYIFKYLEHIPGLEKWVDGVQNPVITRSTT